MKILSIDDQPLILLTLQKRLIGLGYDVQIADSGQKGIDLFQSFQPDLIILDVNMPDMSGLKVAKEIRKAQKYHVPIMIMSGHINDDVHKQGAELGIDDYMKKPVSFHELEARVKRIFNQSIAKETKNLGNLV